MKEQAWQTRYLAGKRLRGVAVTLSVAGASAMTLTRPILPLTLRSALLLSISIDYLALHFTPTRSLTVTLTCGADTTSAVCCYCCCRYPYCWYRYCVLVSLQLPALLSLCCTASNTIASLSHKMHSYTRRSLVLVLSPVLVPLPCRATSR
jgi:hypothetical protein